MQYLLIFFLIILGLIALFYIAWIILALLIRAFSIVVFYWVIGFSVMFVAGLLYSVLIPWRVLNKRGRFPFRQLTPDDVRGGRVFSSGPRGESKHYGWDNAWPMYMPFQAVQDAKGVVGEAQLIVGGMWESVSERIRFASSGGSGVRGVARQAAGLTPKLFWISLLPIPFFGFWCGVWLSVAAWLLAMLAFGSLVWLMQRLALLGLRWFDIMHRKRGNADLRCPYCFGVSRTPSYRCKNPDCTVVHRSMLPGPLGLTTRRCACGTQLPNTIRSAADQLTTVCPYCNHELAGGSGVRHTVQLPVIGSVGAGKTRLLVAATVALQARLDQRDGGMAGLTPAADAYIAAARRLINNHADTAKTPDLLPEGVPLVLRDGADKVTELQLMDAAGESFASWEKTADLRYLDSAEAVLFVLDPLAWPQIKRELTVRGLASKILVTSEDQKSSYSAAIDRMRAEGVPLRGRSLGVVLSKADMLLRLPCAEGLNSGAKDSDSIRTWMIEHDFDLLITGIEMDFGTVHYFLVDSMADRELDDPLNPYWTLEWALRSSRSPLSLEDPPSTAAETAQPVPTNA